jgi:hypothetical protein
VVGVLGDSALPVPTLFTEVRAKGFLGSSVFEHDVQKQGCRPREEIRAVSETAYPHALKLRFRAVLDGRLPQAGLRQAGVLTFLVHVQTTR